MTHGSDQLDLAEIEARIRAKKADLERRLGRFTATPERGSNLSFGKRIGDGTNAAISRRNEIGVGNSLLLTEEKLERARAKLEEGSYGRCDRCGGPIAPGRREAVPASVVCIDCAR